MTVLILGGTSEGRMLAERLADLKIDALTSLAGAVRQPRMPAGRVRVGGFGGAEGFIAVLAHEGVTMIVDATHPFAARITDRSQRIAVEQDILFLRIMRSEWQPEPGDNWTSIATLADAAPLIAPGARVFLATGRQSLVEAAALAHATLLLRVIDPPTEAFPYPNGGFIVGRPPFTEASEQALFAAQGVDVIIAKNAGGDLAAPKLAAARALGLPVLMLRRPPGPVSETVQSVDAAIDWVGAQMGTGQPHG